jgi:hypothetical protein
MRLYWKQSDVNKGRLTLYAPETVYKPVGGSHAWMTEQLETDLGLMGVEAEDYTVIADRFTESDITGGRPPSYLLLSGKRTARLTLRAALTANLSAIGGRNPA